MLLFFYNGILGVTKLSKNNSLDKALRVLDLFLAYPNLKMKDIIQKTTYSKSAIQRVLITLVENGYLYKSEIDKSYRISMKVLLLSDHSNVERQICNITQDLIDELASKIGFTTTFYMMQPNAKILTVCTNDVTMVNGMIPNSKLLQEPPIYISASGKAMLTTMENRDEVISNIKFEKVTDKTVGSAQELREEIKEIEETGYAYDDEGVVLGLFCIARVIPLTNLKPLSSISISGYKASMLEQLDNIKKHLEEYTDLIARRIEKNIVEKD